MKIKFSDSVVTRRRKQPKNQLFKKGDFEFWVNGDPHNKVTYMNYTRKAAVNKAIRDMPGCTFKVIQLPQLE